MGYTSVVVSVLTLFALAAATPSIGDNSLDAGDRVALVSPVFAPPRDSRTYDTTRSRQFPILVLLAPMHPSEYLRPDPETKSLNGNPEPIYVKKLEDQEKPGSLNRQKRHLHKQYGGGYQASRPTVIVVNVHDQGGHKGHGGSGGYGGGGGNNGYSNSYASAIAYASSNSYGKR